MNKKYILQIGFPMLVIILGFGIFFGNTSDSYKEELSYKEYESSNRDAYQSFKENILDELKSKLNLRKSRNWQQDYNSHLQMVSSQFEGPQVHLEKLIYNRKDYHRDTVNAKRDNYPEFVTPFTIHNIVFDPDDRSTGKPDIVVTVIPPVPFEEKRSRNLKGILKRFDGSESQIAPYKTYFKEVYAIKDSTIIIENIKMDLWLTRFEISIETDSWKNKVEDIDEGKRELSNQRHKSFDLVFKIFPNVSPWYVNTGNAFDKKPDMAIGAVYCEGIKKWPKENSNIGVVPKEIGAALPLIKQNYYNNLREPHKLFNQQESKETVWNKALHAIISVPNIGSYRKLTSKGDEKVTFTFIMPLLVRGSWDIQIPSSIIPQYKPLPPYRRSLGNILLPNWGLKIFGKIFSSLIYLVIIAIVGVLLFKKISPF